MNGYLAVDDEIETAASTMNAELADTMEEQADEHLLRVDELNHDQAARRAAESAPPSCASHPLMVALRDEIESAFGKPLTAATLRRIGRLSRLGQQILREVATIEHAIDDADGGNGVAPELPFGSPVPGAGTSNLTETYGAALMRELPMILEKMGVTPGAAAAQARLDAEQRSARNSQIQSLLMHYNLAKEAGLTRVADKVHKEIYDLLEIDPPALPAPKETTTCDGSSPPGTETSGSSPTESAPSSRSTSRRRAKSKGSKRSRKSS